jgi:hypothetical protein
MIERDEGSFCYRFIEECRGGSPSRPKRFEVRREDAQRSVSGNAHHVDVKSERHRSTTQDYRKLQWPPSRTTARFSPQ